MNKCLCLLLICLVLKINGQISFDEPLGFFRHDHDVEDEKFGWSVAVADINGDDVLDLIVGSPGVFPGSVWILFMNQNGTVASRHAISASTEYFLNLSDILEFGESIAVLGDLNNDSIPDIAVGSSSSNDYLGEVWILFLNANGSVKHLTQISKSPYVSLTAYDQFGAGLAVTDIDAEGNRVLLVGSRSSPIGKIYFIDLDSNGAITQNATFISVATGNVGFGTSVAVVDIDGDNVTDIVVGADDKDGAIYLLFMYPNRTVRDYTNITSSRYDNQGFGVSVAVYDFDGDNINDIAVGDDGTDKNIWIYYLNRNGTVREEKKFYNNQSFTNGFGSSIAFASQNGNQSMLVGSYDSLGSNGSMWIFYFETLHAPTTVEYESSTALIETGVRSISEEYVSSTRTEESVTSLSSVGSSTEESICEGVCNNRVCVCSPNALEDLISNETNVIDSYTLYIEGLQTILRDLNIENSFISLNNSKMDINGDLSLKNTTLYLKSSSISVTGCIIIDEDTIIDVNLIPGEDEKEVTIIEHDESCPRIKFENVRLHIAGYNCSSLKYRGSSIVVLFRSCDDIWLVIVIIISIVVVLLVVTILIIFFVPAVNHLVFPYRKRSKQLKNSNDVNMKRIHNRVSELEDEIQYTTKKVKSVKKMVDQMERV